MAIVRRVLKALRTQQSEMKQRRQLQAAVTAVSKTWSVAMARAQALAKMGPGGPGLFGGGSEASFLGSEEEIQEVFDGF